MSSNMGSCIVPAVSIKAMISFNENDEKEIHVLDLHLFGSLLNW